MLGQEIGLHKNIKGTAHGIIIAYSTIAMNTGVQLLYTLTSDIGGVV